MDNVALEKQIRELGKQAVDQLKWVMENESDSAIVLRAVENVLDRIGLGRQSKAEVRQVVSLDPETVELLRGAEAVLRAAEARLGSQLLLPDSSVKSDS